MKYSNEFGKNISFYGTTIVLTEINIELTGSFQSWTFKKNWYWTSLHMSGSKIRFTLKVGSFNALFEVFIL